MEPQTEQAIPAHIQSAQKFMDEMFNMNHKEQLEAFTYIRKNLLERRKEQYEAMLKEIESFSIDATTQLEGTNQILAAL